MAPLLHRAAIIILAKLRPWAEFSCAGACWRAEISDFCLLSCEILWRWGIPYSWKTTIFHFQNGGIMDCWKFEHLIVDRGRQSLNLPLSEIASNVAQNCGEDVASFRFSRRWDDHCRDFLISWNFCWPVWSRRPRWITVAYITVCTPVQPTGMIFKSITFLSYIPWQTETPIRCRA